MDSGRPLSPAELAQRRRWVAGRVQLACGHTDLPVSPGRCWDCHLAGLRAIGQGDRADRLVILKRQRDEGCVDFSRLVEGLVAAYEQRMRPTDKAEHPPTGKATGADRCITAVTRT